MVVVANLVAATSAWAQGATDEREAGRLFRAGVAAFRAGDFEAAARTFEAAHDQVPSGAALYNAGRAWRQADDLPRCLDAWERALASKELTSDQVGYVERTMIELRARAAKLVIDGQGQLTVAHVQNRRLPATVWLPPGKHTMVVIRKDESRYETSVRIDGGAEERLQVPGPVAENAPAAPPVAAGALAVPPPSDVSSVAPVIGWTLIGAAVAAAAVGTTTGILALDARDEFIDSGRLDIDARRRADDLQTGANIAWAVGGGALLGGLAFLLGPVLFGDNAAPSSTDRPPAFDAHTEPTKAIVRFDARGVRVEF